MSKETGGPAFPVGDIVERDEKGHLHGPVIGSSGMTLRDYFAAKAAQGFIAGAMADGTTFGTSADADVIATTSYLVADAMLKARNQ